MNTIHSSSLTHYPVAYSTQQMGRMDASRTSTAETGIKTPGAQPAEPNTRPSSTALIEAALDQAGLANDHASSLPNNSKAQKALNAYTQNYNHTAHRRLAEIISGIDIYA